MRTSLSPYAGRRLLNPIHSYKRHSTKQWVKSFSSRGLAGLSLHADFANQGLES
jgi:hypothetical protein